MRKQCNKCLYNCNKSIKCKLNKLKRRKNMIRGIK